MFSIKKCKLMPKRITNENSLKAVTVTNNDLKPVKTLKGENKKVKNPFNFCPGYFPY